MPFLVTAQIHTESRFQQFSKLVEVRVNAALVEWGRIALEEVRAAETRVGSRPDFNKRKVSPGVHLRDSFQVTVKSIGASGYGSVVVWTDNPNAIWQELGTRVRRRKKLKDGTTNFKAGAETTGGNRGVKPLYFMRKGLRRAYPQGVELMEIALRRVGEFGGGSTLVDTTSPHYFRGSSSKFFGGRYS